jgi:hypothetical protein
MRRRPAAHLRMGIEHQGADSDATFSRHTELFVELVGLVGPCLSYRWVRVACSLGCVPILG